MENHCRDTHEWMMSKGVMWKRQWVQTFFQGKFIKYFPVKHQDGDDELTQPLTESTLNHLIKSLLDEAKERDLEQQRKLNKVSDTQNPMILTP